MGSIMMWWTDEVALLKSQLQHKVGIFACDDYDIYSNKTVSLSDDYDTLVMNGSLTCKFGGKAHTALNQPIFQRFWDRIIENPKAWKNDWIVKVDADAVFFPDRLNKLLNAGWGQDGTIGTVPYAVWLNNCYLGLHGPIEVFNKHAFGQYNTNKTSCNDLRHDYPQEDAWLGACFEKIGVAKVNAYNLLMESKWACNERPASRDNKPPCYDQQVSFHPFKNVHDWFKCYDQAKRVSWSTPWGLVGEKPNPDNHHHA